MKNALKVLLWLALGGSVGFFGGIQVGRRLERKAMEDGDIPEEDDAWADGRLGKAAEALTEYRGEADEAVYADSYKEPIDDAFAGDTDGDGDIPQLPNQTAEWLRKMDCEQYIPPKNEIRMLHPQDMTGMPITEDEYNLNEDNYEIKNLIFYGLDEVVYDESRGEVITEPDSLLGPGFWAGFHGDPNNPCETLYFKNDTMGTIYRLDYVDDAFVDVYAPQGPEDDEPDPMEEDIDEE